MWCFRIGRGYSLRRETKRDLRQVRPVSEGLGVQIDPGYACDLDGTWLMDRILRARLQAMKFTRRLFVPPGFLRSSSLERLMRSYVVVPFHESVELGLHASRQEWDQNSAHSLALKGAIESFD